MKTQLVIFGITGDLAGRKLLPALQSIVDTGEYDDLSIVGVSRREVDIQDLLKNQPDLIARTSIYSLDLADAAAYDSLKASLEAADADQTLFYLSVPPGAAAGIVDFLGQAGMNTPEYKILFEKPFGFDLVSAHEFIERTSRYYDESQLYRIDHYMAKEVAAAVLALRRNASNHHHHWSNESVKSVEVVASESIGIEGRAQFYEQTGALRDFIQGHLMQLLSLVLINKPGSKTLSDERLTALQHLNTADPSKTARAQYEGYQDEAQNPGSLVETFVSMELESSDPNWKGVALKLITGKALNEKRSYIRVTYLDGTNDEFEEGRVFAGDSPLDAYERVLIEAIAGRKEIFTTSPEVIRAWEIVAPVQEAWDMDNEPLEVYEIGAQRT